MVAALVQVMLAKWCCRCDDRGEVRGGSCVMRDVPSCPSQAVLDDVGPGKATKATKRYKCVVVAVVVLRFAKISEF
jgi:hypothetical protein